MGARGNAVPNEVSAMNNIESSQQIAMADISEKNIAKNQDNSKSIAMMEKDSKTYNTKSGACVALFVFGALVIVGLVTIIVFQAKILNALQKSVKKK